MRYIIMFLVWYLFNNSIANFICELSLNMFNFVLTFPIAEIISVVLIIVIVSAVANNLQRN